MNINNTYRILEQNQTFREALVDIIHLKKEDHLNALPVIYNLVEKTLKENKPCFTVFKQVNDGPIYKLEICQKTSEVLKQEMVTTVPSGLSIEEFCKLLAEGNQMDVHIDEG